MIFDVFGSSSLELRKSIMAGLQAAVPNAAPSFDTKIVR